MAKFFQEKLKVTFSQMTRDSEDAVSVISEEFLKSVEEVLTELVGSKVLIELSIEEQ